MKRSINLSLVSYAAWLRLVFDHDVPEDSDSMDEENQEPAEWYWQEDFHVSNTQRLLAHFSRLCHEWNRATKPYTLEQVNQGVWFLLGPPVRLGEELANVKVPTEARIECVRAMLRPYADFVAGSQIEVMENCFEMWWDMLCGDFWSAHRSRLKAEEIDAEMDKVMESDESHEQFLRVADFWANVSLNEDFDEQLQAHGLAREEAEGQSSQIEVSYDDLEADEKRVADAMLETLVAILTQNDQRCEQYALHGLGHLDHPGVRNLVQKFIDQHRSQWDEETLSWVEACRDGTVM